MKFKNNNDFIKCTKCKIIKASVLFSKNKNTHFGHSYVCKKCCVEYTKKRTEELKHRHRPDVRVVEDGYKNCKKCGVDRKISEYNSNKARPSGIYSECKYCLRSKTKYPKSKEYKSPITVEQLKNEQWLPMQINNESFPYMISDCGRVLLSNGNYAKPSLDQRGYPQIVVSNKNKRIGRRIHVLVASHFIANPNNLPQVNHIDGQKFNSFYKNLEWCTAKENKRHSVQTGLWKPLTSEQSGAKKTVIDTETGRVFNSLRSAAEYYDMKTQWLGRRLNGIVKNNTKLKYLPNQ